MKKLNVGSGRDYKKGWVNLDNNSEFKPDIVHDLKNLPLPFKNNTFDEILCSHVLEHLSNQVEVLDELWRISKAKAKIQMICSTFFALYCPWRLNTCQYLFQMFLLALSRHS